MKKISIAISLLLLLTAFVPSGKKKVIFFGDSITELGVKPGGYVKRVDSMCRVQGAGDQYSFEGAGISGNKVYDLFLRMEEDVLVKKPDIVVIYVGVNDVWHKTLLGTGTDPDKFEKFYQAILNKFKAAGIKAVLCTPAVVGEKNDMSNPLDGDLNRYSNIIRDLAKKNNTALIDLRKKFIAYEQENNPENKEKDILTYDKVHMNAKGNQFLAAAMWETIKKL